MPSDETNPKDLIGAKKVPLGLLPGVADIYGSLAMAFGARKYGPYNWRQKKVRMTIYLDAMERHIKALRDGENYAPDSGIHHLGHVIASAAIILDAMENNNLVDDRPAPGPFAKVLERYNEAKLEKAVQPT